MFDDLPPLTIETIQAIVQDQLSDDIVNRLVWRCLGYRYDAARPGWDCSAVAEDWRTAYAEPPNFIDSRPPTVKLTRSIPPEDKQLLKEKLQFKGYQVGELVPRKTRRATVANWLLSHMNQRGMLN